MSDYTRAGLQTLAHAVGDETRAADERNRTRGITASRNREATARLEALKLSIEVTGYSRQANDPGRFVTQETLKQYADMFTRYILTGDMQ